MRRLVALSVILTLANPAKAFLGEENALLAELIVLEADQLAQISALIANVKTLISTANQIGAATRQAYRVYQIIKNYSLKDLLRDVKRGLFQAFPELRGLEKEVNLLKGNIKGLGDGTFLSRVDHHDDEMQRLFESAYRYAFRSTIYPLVFPEGEKLTATPSPVDALVQRRIYRAGLASKRAYEDTVFSVLSQKVQALVEDAEQKERTDLQSHSLNALANTQNANNTARLLTLKELEAATRESDEMKVKQRSEALSRDLAENVQDLFTIGVIE